MMMMTTTTKEFPIHWLLLLLMTMMKMKMLFQNLLIKKRMRQRIDIENKEGRKIEGEVEIRK